MERLYNIIKLPLRFKRFCCNGEKLLHSNCNNSISKINPKKIVSWNIQGLFFYITPVKINNIIQKIKEINADVVCLQEVFEDSIKLKIIQSLKEIYPYYLIGCMDKKYIIAEDSGLLVISKYNINFKKEIILEDCIFPDNFAKKKIIYFSIGEYNFSNTHVQSGSYEIAEKQIKQILNNSPFQKFILVGDLNHYKADKILNLENNNQKNTWENVILDYILPIQYNNLIHDIDVINMDLTNVTDHLPIIAKIKSKEK